MYRAVIGIIFSFNVYADTKSVWGEDGSLNIIISEEPTSTHFINNSDLVTETKISETEPTYIYTPKELVICQPTNQGVICF